LTDVSEESGSSKTGALGPRDGGLPLLKILLVDDDRINRILLHAILKREGYEVFQADDGQQAVKIFDEKKPDLVLMDLMMPVMDGYEATRIIKSRTVDRFVPVIFLTAVTDDKALAKCVTVGGDDFLVKPYNRVVLKAKIDAMVRIRQLYDTMKHQRDEIQYHQDRLRHEHEVAQRVFQKIVPQGSLDTENIKYMLSPASLFNGDLLLATRTPSGSMYVLLGDFTGHGLPAAIGAIPVAEVFYGMANKGFSIAAIVAETNRKLRAILPTEVFFAASFMEVSIDGDSIQVWNGGIPDVIIYGADGTIKERVASQSVPLGVVSNAFLNNEPRRLTVETDDRIYAYSDGLIEVDNPSGEMLGHEGFEALFIKNTDPDQMFESILPAVVEYSAGAEQADDMTIVEIRCAKMGEVTSLPEAFGYSGLRPPLPWKASLEFDALAMRHVDPIPLLMYVITEIQGLDGYREPLYTVLAELYNNALEHGLLELNSKLKNTGEGFLQYYSERQARLSQLEKGKVCFQFEHTPLGEGGRLTIRIQDSGEGFDYENFFSNLNENLASHGRGIELVRSICESVIFSGTGNDVVVEFVWSPKQDS